MAHKILVVDDEQIVRDIADTKLQRAGFEVQTAGDGIEALKCLSSFDADLIVLDVEMPKMNGYIFLSEYNKDSDRRKVPIIVLTAYDSMEPIFRRHGVNEYLLKPLKLQELVVKINEILDHS